jgi:ABC-type branched-subunit amino acid transport system substrate-binding protein
MATHYRAGLIAAGLVACLVQSAYGLDEAEKRGKQIYLEGTSVRGKLINAVVGVEQTMIPASAIPCTNCHGYDGLGRPEGGVVPTDIRWGQLSKTYGHVHENGRRHEAFDEDSLTRSVIAGVDPSNNRLDTSMPLYLLSAEDAADLVAYLKILEYDLDPGIEKDRVRVASLLPTDGRAAGLGQAIEKVLRAHFADVNSQGGIFGRQLELVTVPLGATPEASLENLQQAFDEHGVFALVGGYTIGLDDALLELLRLNNTPLVGPFTLDPGDALLDAAAFYLYPGFAEQVRVLADQAIDAAGDASHILVASPGKGPHDNLASIATDQVRRRSDAKPVTVSYLPGGTDAVTLAEDVLSNDSEAIIFIGNQQDLKPLLTALAEKNLAPKVYVLSSFLSGSLFDVPASFEQRIVVAYPTLASDMTPQGRADYQDLAKRHELPTAHIQVQVATFAAAKVLIEGLRRSGHDLSRSRLVEGVEALYTYQTGLTPPLTYGPNRRIGARGAHLLTVDIKNQKMIPVGVSWHEVR